MQLLRRINLTELRKALTNTLCRFPVAMTITAMAAIYCLIVMWSSSKEIEEFFSDHISMFMYSIYATVLSISITLATEQSGKIRTTAAVIINCAIVIVGALISLWWDLTGFDLIDASNQSVKCLLIAEMVLAAYLPFIIPFHRKDDERRFINFLHIIPVAFIQAFILYILLMLGLFGALLAIDALFDVSTSWVLYTSIATFCVVAGITHFAALIPDSNGISGYVQESRFDKVLGLYIITPLMILYGLILYIYMLTSIIKWELPDAPVTWLVTTITITSVLLQHILYGHYDSNKAVRIIARWTWIILLPLVIMMSVGLIYRINQYGLTINRALVFVFNIWVYFICIHQYITRSRKLRIAGISFCALAIITCALPFNISDAALMSQKRRLLNILNNNALLNPDGKIDYNTIGDGLAKLDNETIQEIQEHTMYIRDKYPVEEFTEMCVNYNDDRQTDPFLRIYNTVSANKYYYVHLSKDEPIDVSGFRHMRQYEYNEIDIIDGDHIVFHKSDDDSTTVDMSDWLRSFDCKLDSTTELNNVPCNELSIRTNNGKEKIILEYLCIRKEPRTDSLFISSISMFCLSK